MLYTFRSDNELLFFFLLFLFSSFSFFSFSLGGVIHDLKPMRQTRREKASIFIAFYFMILYSTVHICRVNDMIRLLDTYELPWLHFFYYSYNLFIFHILFSYLFSFVYLFIYSFTYLFIYLLMYSFMYSFIYLFHLLLIFTWNVHYLDDQTC